jgi:hypothetical protein
MALLSYGDESAQKNEKPPFGKIHFSYDTGRCRVAVVQGCSLLN